MTGAPKNYKRDGFSKEKFLIENPPHKILLLKYLLF